MCIDSSLWCDGNNDCGDFSDEMNCSDYTSFACKDKKQFQCKSDRTMCLDPSEHCDGHPDCPNGEDEVDCESGCSRMDFRCSNGECIEAVYQCDGMKGEVSFFSTLLNEILEFSRDPSNLIPFRC